MSPKAKKVESRRKRPDLWSRDKVLRLITSMGWDAQKFDQAYEESKGTRHREPRGPSTEELHAVRVWLVEGIDQNLKKTLGLKSQAAIDGVVRKAMKILRTEHSFGEATGKSSDK